MDMSKKQGCVIVTTFTTPDTQAAVDIKESIAALVNSTDDYRVDFRLVECKDGIAERRLDNQS